MNHEIESLAKKMTACVSILGYIKTQERQTGTSNIYTSMSNGHNSAKKAVKDRFILRGLQIR